MIEEAKKIYTFIIEIDWKRVCVFSQYLLNEIGNISLCFCEAIETLVKVWLKSEVERVVER